jgi:glutamate-1-semialdehyde 2,1-aminomutase
MRKGMAEVLARHRQPGTVIGDGPLGQIVFAPVQTQSVSAATASSVQDSRSVQGGDSAKRRALMLSLLAGDAPGAPARIFLNPLGTKFYISLQHSEQDIDLFVDCLDKVMAHVNRSK